MVGRLRIACRGQRGRHGQRGRGIIKQAPPRRTAVSSDNALDDLVDNYAPATHKFWLGRPPHGGLPNQNWISVSIVNKNNIKNITQNMYFNIKFSLQSKRNHSNYWRYRH